MVSEFNLGFTPANFSYNAKKLSGEALTPETNQFLTEGALKKEVKYQQKPFFNFQKDIAIRVKNETDRFDKLMGDSWRVPAYQVVEKKQTAVKKLFGLFNIKNLRFLH